MEHGSISFADQLASNAKHKEREKEDPSMIRNAKFAHEATDTVRTGRQRRPTIPRRADCYRSRKRKPWNIQISIF